VPRIKRAARKPKRSGEGKAKQERSPVVFAQKQRHFSEEGERGSKQHQSHGGAAQGGGGEEVADGQDRGQASRLVLFVGLGRRRVVRGRGRQGQDLPPLRPREARPLRPRRRQA
jgi:hypothetical protein